jgi:hypothetical protein
MQGIERGFGGEDLAEANGRAMWLVARDEVGQEEGEASRGGTGGGGCAASVSEAGDGRREKE